MRRARSGRRRADRRLVEPSASASPIGSLARPGTLALEARRPAPARGSAGRDQPIRSIVRSGPPGTVISRCLPRHPHQVRHGRGPVGEVFEHFGADHQVEPSAARPGFGGQVEVRNSHPGSVPSGSPRSPGPRGRSRTPRLPSGGPGSRRAGTAGRSRRRARPRSRAGRCILSKSRRRCLRRGGVSVGVVPRRDHVSVIVPGDGCISSPHRTSLRGRRRSVHRWRRRGPRPSTASATSLGRGASPCRTG